MKLFEGKALSTPAGGAIIRKTPPDGMKIGLVKTGNHFKGDRLENASDGKLWMHISEPMVGWVNVSQVDYKETIQEPVDETSTIPADNTQTESSPSPVSNLFKVRTWGDPVMVKQGFDVDLIKSSNFQAVPLYIEDGSGGGVSSFLNIPRADVANLERLQVADNFTVKQKMNWLCDFRGRIYMYDDKSDDWETAASIRWGTIALGGNLVQVEEVTKMNVKPPDGDRREMDMARLASFRKTDWDKTWQTHPHLVHRAYCTYFPNNKFGDSPKGIVYTPFWSPLDWDFVGISQPEAWYIPLEWLEPVGA